MLIFRTQRVVGNVWVTHDIQNFAKTGENIMKFFAHRFGEMGMWITELGNIQWNEDPEKLLARELGECLICYTSSKGIQAN